MEEGTARTNLLESVRRGYSEEEIHFIYEHIRIALMNGEIKWAKVVLDGLTELAPDYVPGWLALSYVSMFDRDFDLAISASHHAARIDAQSVEAALFLSTCYMSQGDYQTAGTNLGEAFELIESQGGNDGFRRLYRLLLERFNRTR